MTLPPANFWEGREEKEMAERVKIYNDTKFDIGLRDTRGIEFNIRPHAFALFEKQEVEYFVTVARKLFEAPRRLRIDDQDL